MERVFVYGTLKRGQRNHPLVVPYLHRVLPGSVAGFRLYHLGAGERRPYAYPAMVPGEGRVYGEVLFLSPQALPLLDALEEEGVEYRRVRVWVETPEGRLSAWTYLYLAELEGARPLPEGVWEG
ncbi:gamma-glutamylcyclotransferase family protein [Thermus islandicus]|uniref:gamma-glutamylcyclotransferase family protein n=1 Tax=Thermus islandicus TaxID=540988 RepID=UPI0003B7AC12|nr:gamma-glutamylcyclotransferase family protein [Thermus islandicus]